MGRGQISLELIILFTFIVLVFIAFLGIVQTKILEQREERSVDLYAQLTDIVEREVLLAERVRPGYRRQFELPPTLEGEAYELTLEDGDTLVIKGNATAREYLRFLSVKVTGVESPPSGGIFHVRNGTNPLVIITKNSTGIHFRKDCVAAGKNASACD